jgi:hypothetical protein
MTYPVAVEKPRFAIKTPANMTLRIQWLRSHDDCSGLPLRSLYLTGTFNVIVPALPFFFMMELVGAGGLGLQSHAAHRGSDLPASSAEACN